MPPDRRSRGPASARRWLVFDPGLRDVASHHIPVAAALRREAQRRGLDMRIFGHRDLDPAIADAVGATPLFQFHPYTIPRPDPHAGHLSAFVYGLGLTLRDLAGAPVGRVSPDDVMLWPTAHAWEMSATARLFGRIPRDRQPVLAATFHVMNGLLRSDPDPQDVWRATNRLAALDLARTMAEVHLSALTDSLGRLLETYYERPVAAAPSLTAIDLLADTEPAAASRRVDGQPRIAFIGIPRREKRGDLLPEIVARIADRMPRAPVFVQTASHGADRRAIPSMPQRDNVTTHDGPLSYDALLDLYRRTAIVIFPHHAEAYRHRPSGIFTEAVAAACITVVPPGSWMAQEVERGHAVGVIARSTDPDALASAAAEAAARLDALSPAAGSAARSWQKRHGVGAWLDCLIAQIGLEPR